MDIDRDDETLLEGDIPLSELNERSYKERYARKGHPRSIKTWWARRPHTAMRGILYGGLVNNSSLEERRTQLEQLSKKIHPDEHIIEQVRQQISNDFEDQPTILDFFSGGGVIPYESARLGLDTYSIELNEVGVLVQKAIIEGPSKYPNIVTEVEKWGKWVIERSREETKDLFTYTGEECSSSSPIVYFFSRTITCPECGNKIPLFNIGSFSKKNDPLFIDLEVGETSYSYYKSLNKPTFENKGRGGKTECPFCLEEIGKDYLQQCGESGNIDEEVFAVSTVSEGETGKNFSVINISEQKYPEISESDVQERINNLLEEIDTEIPSVDLKNWSGILNPALYGHDSIEDIFNSRQLLVTLTLIKYIRKSYKQMVDEGVSKNKARYVLYILTSLTDHLADWNNRFTMWIPQNEQCGRSLAGPGVPMRWDYIEINPFGGGPANLSDKLSRVISSLKKTPDFEGTIDIKQGDATNLPHSDEMFDVVMVDPPYYNSLVYSGLSDFFLPWQEMILQGIDDEYNSINTHSDKEIVAHDAVVENPDQFYTDGLTKSFREANRVLKDDGIFIVVFSHKTIDGWSSLARSIKESRFKVTNVVPLDMERTARPRAMNSDALSSVMNLSMRKIESNTTIRFRDIEDQISDEIEEQINEVIDERWVSSDLLTFVFSKCLKYYTKYDIQYENDNLIEFEEYYSLIMELLGGVVENKFEELYKHSTWDTETKLYIYYRLCFGISSIDTAEFESLLQKLGIEDISHISNWLYIKDGDQIEIPSVILEDTDIDNNSSLIYEVADIINHILDENNVEECLPKKMSHSSKELRHTINLLAGTELVRIDTDNNKENQKVRQAISKLAQEGNLLQKAEKQKTIGDF